MGALTLIDTVVDDLRSDYGTLGCLGLPIITAPLSFTLQLERVSRYALFRQNLTSWIEACQDC